MKPEVIFLLMLLVCLQCDGHGQKRKAKLSHQYHEQNELSLASRKQLNRFTHATDHDREDPIVDTKKGHRKRNKNVKLIKKKSKVGNKGQRTKSWLQHKPRRRHSKKKRHRSHAKRHGITSKMDKSRKKKKKMASTSKANRHSSHKRSKSRSTKTKVWQRQTASTDQLQRNSSKRTAKVARHDVRGSSLFSHLHPIPEHDANATKRSNYLIPTPENEALVIDSSVPQNAGMENVGSFETQKDGTERIVLQAPDAESLTVGAKTLMEDSRKLVESKDEIQGRNAVDIMLSDGFMQPSLNALGDQDPHQMSNPGIKQLAMASDIDTEHALFRIAGGPNFDKANLGGNNDLQQDYVLPGNGGVLDKIMEILHQAQESSTGCESRVRSAFTDCTKKRDGVCRIEDLDEFRQNAMQLHNKLRAIHKSPALELNDFLNREAQKYAVEMAQVSSVKHSNRKTRPGQGENIAVSCTSAGSQLRADEAVTEWYGKVCRRSFDFKRYVKGIEPFLQMIWKSTNYLGIGKAVSKKDGILCTYVVCRYSPEADKSYMTDNVQRGTFSNEQNCRGNCPHAETADGKEESQALTRVAEYMVNKNPGTDTLGPESHENLARILLGTGTETGPAVYELPKHLQDNEVLGTVEATGMIDDHTVHSTNHTSTKDTETVKDKGNDLMSLLQTVVKKLGTLVNGGKNASEMKNMQDSATEADNLNSTSDKTSRNHTGMGAALSGKHSSKEDNRTHQDVPRRQGKGRKETAADNKTQGGSSEETPNDNWSHPPSTLSNTETIKTPTAKQNTSSLGPQYKSTKTQEGLPASDARQLKKEDTALDLNEKGNENSNEESNFDKHPQNIDDGKTQQKEKNVVKPADPSNDNQEKPESRVEHIIDSDKGSATFESSDNADSSAKVQRLQNAKSSNTDLQNGSEMVDLYEIAKLKHQKEDKPKEPNLPIRSRKAYKSRQGHKPNSATESNKNIQTKKTKSKESSFHYQNDYQDLNSYAKNTASNLHQESRQSFNSMPSSTDGADSFAPNYETDQQEENKGLIENITGESVNELSTSQSGMTIDDKDRAVEPTSNQWTLSPAPPAQVQFSEQPFHVIHNSLEQTSSPTDVKYQGLGITTEPESVSGSLGNEVKLHYRQTPELNSEFTGHEEKIHKKVHLVTTEKVDQEKYHLIKDRRNSMRNGNDNEVQRERNVESRRERDQAEYRTSNEEVSSRGQESERLKLWKAPVDHTVSLLQMRAADHSNAIKGKKKMEDLRKSGQRMQEEEKTIARPNAQTSYRALSPILKQDVIKSYWPNHRLLGYRAPDDINQERKVYDDGKDSETAQSGYEKSLDFDAESVHSQWTGGGQTRKRLMHQKTSSRNGNQFKSVYKPNEENKVHEEHLVQENHKVTSDDEGNRLIATGLSNVPQVEETASRTASRLLTTPVKKRGGAPHSFDSLQQFGVPSHFERLFTDEPLSDNHEYDTPFTLPTGMNSQRRHNSRHRLTVNHASNEVQFTTNPNQVPLLSDYPHGRHGPAHRLQRRKPPRPTKPHDMDSPDDPTDNNTEQDILSVMDDKLAEQQGRDGTEDHLPHGGAGYSEPPPRHFEGYYTYAEPTHSPKIKQPPFESNFPSQKEDSYAPAYPTMQSHVQEGYGLHNYPNMNRHHEQLPAGGEIQDQSSSMPAQMPAYKPAQASPLPMARVQMPDYPQSQVTPAQMHQTTQSESMPNQMPKPAVEQTLYQQPEPTKDEAPPLDYFPSGSRRDENSTVAPNVDQKAIQTPQNGSSMSQAIQPNTSFIDSKTTVQTTQPSQVVTITSTQQGAASQGQDSKPMGNTVTPSNPDAPKATKVYMYVTMGEPIPSDASKQQETTGAQNARSPDTESAHEDSRQPIVITTKIPQDVLNNDNHLQTNQSTAQESNNNPVNSGTNSNPQPKVYSNPPIQSPMPQEMPPQVQSMDKVADIKPGGHYVIDNFVNNITIKATENQVSNPEPNQLVPPPPIAPPQPINMGQGARDPYTTFNQPLIKGPELYHDVPFYGTGKHLDPKDSSFMTSKENKYPVQGNNNHHMHHAPMREGNSAIDTTREQSVQDTVPVVIQNKITETPPKATHENNNVVFAGPSMPVQDTKEDPWFFGLHKNSNGGFFSFNIPHFQESKDQGSKRGHSQSNPMPVPPQPQPPVHPSHSSARVNEEPPLQAEPERPYKWQESQDDLPMSEPYVYGSETNVEVSDDARYFVRGDKGKQSHQKGSMSSLTPMVSSNHVNQRRYVNLSSLSTNQERSERTKLNKDSHNKKEVMSGTRGKRHSFNHKKGQSVPSMTGGEVGNARRIDDKGKVSHSEMTTDSALTSDNITSSVNKTLLSPYHSDVNTLSGSHQSFSKARDESGVEGEPANNANSITHFRFFPTGKGEKETATDNPSPDANSGNAMSDSDSLNATNASYKHNNTKIKGKKVETSIPDQEGKRCSITETKQPSDKASIGRAANGSRVMLDCNHGIEKAETKTKRDTFDEQVNKKAKMSPIKALFDYHNFDYADHSPQFTSPAPTSARHSNSSVQSNVTNTCSEGGNCTTAHHSNDTRTQKTKMKVLDFYSTESGESFHFLANSSLANLGVQESLNSTEEALNEISRQSATNGSISLASVKHFLATDPTLLRETDGSVLKVDQGTKNNTTSSYCINGTKCRQYIAVGKDGRQTETPLPITPVLIPVGVLKAFRDDMIKLHNDLRKIHIAPPLVINQDLNFGAQSYATDLAQRASIENSNPETRLSIGESIAEVCSEDESLPTAEQVVHKWYLEVCIPGFDFKKRAIPHGTQEFTQMVWRGTKELGIGMAAAKSTNGTLCSYIVARYKKAGNLPDFIDDNVMKGDFQEKKCKGPHLPQGTRSSNSVVPNDPTKPFAKNGVMQYSLEPGTTDLDYKDPLESGTFARGIDDPGTIALGLQDIGKEDGEMWKMGLENAKVNPDDSKGSNNTNVEIYAKFEDMPATKIGSLHRRSVWSDDAAKVRRRRELVNKGISGQSFPATKPMQPSRTAKVSAHVLPHKGTYTAYFPRSSQTKKILAKKSLVEPIYQTAVSVNRAAVRRHDRGPISHKSQGHSDASKKSLLELDEGISRPKAILYKMAPSESQDIVNTNGVRPTRTFHRNKLNPYATNPVESVSAKSHAFTILAEKYRKSMQSPKTTTQTDGGDDSLVQEYTQSTRDDDFRDETKGMVAIPKQNALSVKFPRPVLPITRVNPRIQAGSTNVAMQQHKNIKGSKKYKFDVGLLRNKKKAYLIIARSPQKQNTNMHGPLKSTLIPSDNVSERKKPFKEPARESRGEKGKSLSMGVMNPLRYISSSRSRHGKPDIQGDKRMLDNTAGVQGSSSDKESLQDPADRTPPMTMNLMASNNHPKQPFFVIDSKNEVKLVRQPGGSKTVNSSPVSTDSQTPGFESAVGSDKDDSRTDTTDTVQVQSISGSTTTTKIVDALSNAGDTAPGKEDTRVETGPEGKPGNTNGHKDQMSSNSGTEIKEEATQNITDTDSRQTSEPEGGGETFNNSNNSYMSSLTSSIHDPKGVTKGSEHLITTQNTDIQTETDSSDQKAEEEQEQDTGKKGDENDLNVNTNKAGNEEPRHENEEISSKPEKNGKHFIMDHEGHLILSVDEGLKSNASQFSETQDGSLQSPESSSSLNKAKNREKEVAVQYYNPPEADSNKWKNPAKIDDKTKDYIAVALAPARLENTPETDTPSAKAGIPSKVAAEDNQKLNYQHNFTSNKIDEIQRQREEKTLGSLQEQQGNALNQETNPPQQEKQRDRYSYKEDYEAAMRNLSTSSSSLSRLGTHGSGIRLKQSFPAGIESVPGPHIVAPPTDSDQVADSAEPQQSHGYAESESNDNKDSNHAGGPEDSGSKPDEDDNNPTGSLATADPTQTSQQQSAVSVSEQSSSEQPHFENEGTAELRPVNNNQSNPKPADSAEGSAAPNSAPSLAPPKRKPEDLTEFIQDALITHNRLRLIHGAPPLKLDQDLCVEAEEYANRIITEKKGILEHSKRDARKGEGENLAMSCKSSREGLTGAEATFKWYSDICEKGYDFKSPDIQIGTGHFTQLVWKASRRFGIGRTSMKKNGRFCTVVVARYSPQGNVEGEFSSNVEPGAFNDKTCDKVEQSFANLPWHTSPPLREDEKPLLMTDTAVADVEYAHSDTTQGGNAQVLFQPTSQNNSESYANKDSGVSVARLPNQNDEHALSVNGRNPQDTDSLKSLAREESYQEQELAKRPQTAASPLATKDSGISQEADDTSIEAAYNSESTQRFLRRNSSNSVTEQENDLTSNQFNRVKGNKNTELHADDVPAKEPQRVEANPGNLEGTSVVDPNVNVNGDAIGQGHDYGSTSADSTSLIRIGRPSTEANNSSAVNTADEQREQKQKERERQQAIKEEELREKEKQIEEERIKNEEKLRQEEKKQQEEAKELEEERKEMERIQEQERLQKERQNALKGQGEKNKEKGRPKKVKDNKQTAVQNVDEKGVANFKADNEQTTGENEVNVDGNKQQELHTGQENEADNATATDNESQLLAMNAQLSSESGASNPGLLGTPSLLGLASYGSPVVIHLGATGKFEDIETFIRVGLEIHNRFRKIHKSPPLALDPLLVELAYQYAVQLSYTGYLKHQSAEKLGGQGENLAMGCYDNDFEMSAEEAVTVWYSEVCQPGYDFNSKVTYSGTGHFTELIWGASTKMGMAKVSRMQNGLKCTYVVARYFPAGNENEKFSENVKQGKFDEKQVCSEVTKTLLSFQERNEKAIEKQEKEKQEFRMSMLQWFKEAEKELTTSLLATRNQTEFIQRPGIVKTGQSIDASANLQVAKNAASRHPVTAHRQRQARFPQRLLFRHKPPQTRIIESDNSDSKTKHLTTTIVEQDSHGWHFVDKNQPHLTAPSLNNKPEDTKGPQIVSPSTVLIDESVNKIKEVGSTQEKPNVQVALHTLKPQPEGEKPLVRLRPTFPERLVMSIQRQAKAEPAHEGPAPVKSTFPVEQSMGNENLQRRLTPDSEAFRMSTLNAHNAYRRIHGTTPLHLDFKMSLEAEDYAKKIAQLGKLEHSDTDDGENIASVCRTGNNTMTGQEATTIWYREVCHPGYNFVTGLPGNAGHFTQEIWRSTHLLGVGRASLVREGLLCTYIVARYRPAGNYLGEFVQNVPLGHFTGKLCNNLARKDLLYPSPSLRGGVESPVTLPARVRKSFVHAKTKAVFSSHVLRKQIIAAAAKNKKLSTHPFILKTTLSRPSSVKARVVSDELDDDWSLSKRSLVPTKPPTASLHTRVQKSRSKSIKGSGAQNNSFVVTSESKYNFSGKSDNRHSQDLGSTILKTKHDYKFPNNKTLNLTVHDVSNRTRKAAQHVLKHALPQPSFGTYNQDPVKLRSKQNQTERGSKRNFQTEYVIHRDLLRLSSGNAKILRAQNNRKESSDHTASQVLAEGTRSRHIVPKHAKPIETEKKETVDEEKGDEESIVIIERSNGITKVRNFTIAKWQFKNSSNSPENSTAVSKQNIKVIPLQSPREVTSFSRALNTSKPTPKSEDNKEKIDVRRPLTSNVTKQEPPPRNVQLKTASMRQNTSNDHVQDTLKKGSTAIQALTRGNATADKGRLMLEASDKSKSDLKAPHNPLTLLATAANLPPDILLGPSGGFTARRRLFLAASRGMELLRKLQGKGQFAQMPLGLSDATLDTSAAGNALLINQRGLESAGLLPKQDPPSLFNGNSTEVGVIVSRLRDNLQRVISGARAADDKLHHPTTSLNSSQLARKDVSSDTGHTRTQPYTTNQKGKEDDYNIMSRATKLWPNIADSLATTRSESQPLLSGIGSGSLLGATGGLFTHPVYHDHDLNHLAAGTVPSPLALTAALKHLGLLPHPMTYPEHVDAPLPHVDHYDEFSHGYHHPEPPYQYVPPPMPQIELPTKVDIGPAMADSSGGIHIPMVTGGDYPINAMTGEKLPGTGAATEFQQTALNAHNKYRAVHSAGPLVINKAMCPEAEAWAAELAARGTLVHSTTTDGENLAVNCKPKDRFTEMTGAEATDLWYKEVCEPGYVFNLGHIAGAGDFTQLVWKATSDMCIGKAVGASGDNVCTYVVARYRPAGNLLGSVRENVVKGELHKDSYCDIYGPVGSSHPSGVPGVAIGEPLHGGNDMAPLQPPGGDDPGLGAASLNTKEFRLGALNAHNTFRALHNAAPLALNAAMSLEAEEYATVLAKKSSLMRNAMTRDGENIAMACNNKDLEMTGDEATTKWYNEICNPGYDFKGNQPYGAAHFTQLVWKDTKLFGIGKATVRRNGLFCTYVVARYRPAGNIINMFKEEIEMGRFDYGYCDTLGKGGGGKGMSSGVPSGKGVEQDEQWAASSLYNRAAIQEQAVKKASLLRAPHNKTFTAAPSSSSKRAFGSFHNNSVTLAPKAEENYKGDIMTTNRSHSQSKTHGGATELPKHAVYSRTKTRVDAIGNGEVPVKWQAAKKLRNHTEEEAVVLKSVTKKSKHLLPKTNNPRGSTKQSGPKHRHRKHKRNNKKRHRRRKKRITGKKEMRSFHHRKHNKRNFLSRRHRYHHRQRHRFYRDYHTMASRNNEK